MRWETTNRAFLYSLMGLLAASLAFALWFRGRMIAGMNQSVESAARVFDAETLRRPQDFAVSFALLGRLLQISRQNPFVQDIVVFKTLPDGSQWPVAPFYLPVLNPGWRDGFRNWRRLDVVVNGVNYGTVFVLMDERVLRAINLATVIFALLLIGSVGLTIWRVLTQQHALARTLTALEEKQSQLIRMERLALAGQLTANIFHDIRKPVLNIKHAVAEQLAALGLPADGTGADVAAHTSVSHQHSDPAIWREIQDQIAVFFSMLHDLNLERFVRAQDSEQEYVDINDVVMRSLNLVKYEQGQVRVETRLGEGLPIILGYPYRLIQVFSNLILNACQAMEGRGTLRLTTRAAQDGRAVIVEVEDSGPGIPPAMREKVFEPFFTTRETVGGSGLGLYIVRMICEQSGARIELGESVLGGALFRVVMPVEPS
ncbi:MAG: hypothetical protein Kow0059_03910 [Candidatus Sumerlaeia bacterium]